jgi:hypothetical protein
MSTLSIVSLLVGVGLMVPPVYGLSRPVLFTAAARRFPRAEPIGFVLMILGTGWFLWNVGQESISDFASYKNLLIAVFAAIGLGSCIFVRDFLAVRGLAVMLLLVGKLMVDTGRPTLPNTPIVLVVQSLAYVLVIAGIWLTISPWRLRDWINWCTASESRLKLSCSVALAVGLLVAGLGVMVF